VLILQIFRGALLGGGALALGNGIALSYGGGHKVVTCVGWYVLAGLLLAAGVVFWVEIHRRKKVKECGEGQSATKGISTKDRAKVTTVGGRVSGFDHGIESRDDSEVTTEDTDIETDPNAESN
jgi:hypothetical protein